jgi:hypothetical protein
MVFGHVKELFMRRIFPVLFTLGLLTPAAFAQSAAGTWTGETQGRGGTQMLTLTREVAGSTLTGTYAQGEQSGAISEGTVEGNMIAFQRNLEFGGNPVTLSYTGQIEGNTLTLTTTGGGRGGGGGGRGAPMPIVLTRQ